MYIHNINLHLFSIIKYALHVFEFPNSFKFSIFTRFTHSFNIYIILICGIYICVYDYICIGICCKYSIRKVCTVSLSMTASYYKSEWINWASHSEMCTLSGDEWRMNEKTHNLIARKCEANKLNHTPLNMRECETKIKHENAK